MSSPDHSGEERATLEEVRQWARRLSYDRYLASLLAPKAARPLLWALHGFAGEIAHIPERMSEPMLGEIRFQWWRDALDGVVRGERSGNPLADALAPVIVDDGARLAKLKGMVDARAFDLGGAEMADVRALTTYLAKTEGQEFALAVQLLSGETSPEVESACVQAGIAYGLARLLCTLPLCLARGAMPIPSELLRLNQAGEPAALNDIEPVQLNNALSDAAELAADASATARRHVGMLSRIVRPAVLPLALVPSYLAAARRPGRDPLSEIALINPVMRVWSLYRAHLLGFGG